MTVTEKESFHPILLTYGRLDFEFPTVRGMNTEDVLAPARNRKFPTADDGCQQSGKLCMRINTKPVFKTNFTILRRDHVAW